MTRKTSATDDCKHCQFYHGDNSIICAVRPFGPGAHACTDFHRKKITWKTRRRSLQRVLAQQAAKDTTAWLSLICGILVLSSIYSFFNVFTSQPHPPRQIEIQRDRP